MMVLFAFVTSGAIWFFTILCVMRSETFPASLFLFNNLPSLVNSRALIMRAGPQRMPGVATEWTWVILGHINIT